MEILPGNNVDAVSSHDFDSYTFVSFTDSAFFFSQSKKSASEFSPILNFFTTELVSL